jgi:Protein of unknown function (DUF4238)
MAIARKHHYVPQMYLSGFTNDREQCFAVDASTGGTFRSTPEGIAAKRDFNLIDEPGMPADALEKELGKLEGEIAPGIRRIRENATFGENAIDREDMINLLTLLAVRNPRTRAAMNKVYTDLIQGMVVMTFNKEERWKAAVEAMKAAGKWPADKSADFEDHKKFVEENISAIKPHKNFTLRTELDALGEIYWYFDAYRWRILKAADGAGGFVTTDHPVCMDRPGAGIYYGQQAPGLGLADRDILFPLSSNVAVIGRREGAEDILEINRHNVASFNATVMGFAMKQIYSADDQYYYARSSHFPIGRGFALLKDPKFKVREG